MADRIKGITIEIGGDATKLSKELQGVNKEIKDTQRQLQDVNKLLKLDPTNSTLIQQKFKLLGTSINDTKDKLEKLKSVQKEMDEGLRNGTVSQTQYDAWQREIIATEEELKNLEKQMKETDSTIQATLKESGSKMKETGEKISNAGEGLTKGVTAPILAIGAASAAAWSEVDEAMDTIVTKTGASGEALEDMQKRAQNIANTIPTDFQKAGDAVGEVNTRFGLTGDALEKLSTQFIQFATINDTDVSGSIDSVQASMAAWNVDAKDAGLMLDTLNKAGQDTGVNVVQLADDLTKNAASMQEMGFSASDAAFFLANLNKNGLDASTVMTGFKTALKNATKDGKTTSEALKEMQDKMKGAKSETEAMSIATELFGSKAGPVLGKALYEGKLSLDQLGTSMSDFAGNTEDAFNGTLDPIDQMTVAMNNLKTVGAELFTAFQRVAMPFLQGLVGALKTLTSAFQSLAPWQQDLIVKIALIAAAVGPLLVVVGKVISAVGTITTALAGLPGVTTAVAGAGSAIVTFITGTLLPGIASVASAVAAVVGWPVLIVAAVAAGIALLYKHCEGFRNFVNGLFSGIKDAAVTAWNGISTFFTESVPNFFSSIGEHVSNGLSAIHGYTSEKLSAVRAAYEEHGGGVKGVVFGMMEGIKQYYSVGYDFINTLTGGKLGEVASKFKSKMSEAKAAVSEALSNVKNSFTSGLSAAYSTVTSKFEAIRSAIHQKISAAAEVVRSGIDRLKSFFNFSWSLPHLKLPHFSISGSFSLNPPSVPHFGIDWYAKAMQDGMILNSPTIFGAMGGKLLGGGEAGPEAVVGVDSLRGMIAEAAGGAGPITIPVYIGQRKIDTIVVDAINRTNYRSGGR